MTENREICIITRYREYAENISASVMLSDKNIPVFAVGKNFDEKYYSKKGFRLYITADDDTISFPDNSEGQILKYGFSTMDCISSLKGENIKGKTVYIAAEKADGIDFGLLSSLFNAPAVHYDPCASRENERFEHKDPNGLYLCAPESYESAKAAGINFKPLCFCRETISFLLNSASEILRVKKDEEEKNKENLIRMEQYKVVFNFTNDAILATDENGIIIAANDMVYKFLKWDKRDRLEGKRIDSVVKGTKMIKAMDKEGGDIGDVFELPYCTVLTHRIPIEINGKKKGVVSTFQDLATLQEHEKNARVSFYRNKKGFSAKYSFADIKGGSKKIEEAKNIAKSYAPSSAAVLILGETGTGKELFAQSIHNASGRHDGPFVAVNCAAIPKSLLEAEFFGYEEGSFTGASKGGKMGVFEMAHKGTIFLDEIGEMPLDMQAQLLRAIQEKEIRRIGSGKVIPVDVRVISATNRNLRGEVKKGSFREDLFYRLNVLELIIPPLRERKEDIFEIAVSYLRTFNYKSYKNNQALWHEIIDELEKYELRGNVRELQNLLERLSVMLDNKYINTNALFAEISKGIDFQTPYDGQKRRRPSHLYDDSEPFGREEADLWEKNKILQALKNNGFSRTKAAADLGISRSTLWSKMKYHKIEI
ncbi:sigma 54-interacting transcriptional regulator [Anaerotignum faecicola]|nr:sigma 54-interacting transcriptional regulator [Anaerotignum faecicola]